MKKALFAVALVVATPAVAQEYRKASGFEQVKAYCELFATAGQTNYSLLGGPIQHANLYEQCTVLKGLHSRIADRKSRAMKFALEPSAVEIPPVLKDYDYEDLDCRARVAGLQNPR